MSEWKRCVPIVHDMIDEANECQDRDEKAQKIAALYRYLVQEEKCHAMINSNPRLSKVIKEKLGEFISIYYYRDTFMVFESDINKICAQTGVTEPPKVTTTNQDCQLTHRKSSSDQENETVEPRVYIQPGYLNIAKDEVAPSKRTGYCLVM